jgi:alkaline phosphatase D
MLGREQREALLTWLEQSTQCQWRILASSVPMTTNWKVDDDTWIGYGWERDLILNWIHVARSRIGLRNVVVISGDRHAVGIQRLSPHNEVVEYCTSPISQFYPPINFYDRSGGDQMIYEKVAGIVKFSWFDVYQNRLEFKLYVGDQVDFTWTLPAESPN